MAQIVTRALPVFCLVLALAAAVVSAAPAVDSELDPLWYAVDEQDGQPAVTVKLYVFWSQGCPHCAHARPFLESLAAARPWLEAIFLEVSGSPLNRDWFGALAARTGNPVQGVPTVFLCGHMLVGYDDAEGMGARIARQAERCRARAATAIGQESAPAVSVSPAGETDATGSDSVSDRAVDLPGLGPIDPAAWTLPALTVVLAGLDAFNPCAFFVLLFLLSLMVHARSRRRMALIGGVFVLISGLAYFAFMAAWLNLFLVVGGLSWITAVAGLVALVVGALNIKDFVRFHRGPTLAIPESAKPGLFARMRGLLAAERLPVLLVGTVTLAIAANTYELLCTSGFPLVYTRILTLRDLAPSEYYLYLVLYNAVYVLPLLAIVVVFTVTLGARRLSEHEGRVLKLLSGLMMAGLGTVLLVAPHLVSNALTAAALLVAALGLTALCVLLERAVARHRAAR